MKKYVWIFMVFWIAGCGSNPLYKNDGQPLAKMTFDHIEAYPVDVGLYSTVPFVQNKSWPAGFTVKPGKHVFDYFNHRFKASGTEGELRITVEDITVDYALKDPENRVGAFLQVGRQEHYHVKVHVHIQALGVSGLLDQGVRLVAHRNVYISEHSSLVDREKAQMQAVDNLIDDLDIAVRKVLNEQFSLNVI